MREKFVVALKEAFPDYGLTYSIGKMPTYLSILEGALVARTLSTQHSILHYFFGLLRRTNFFRCLPHWLGQDLLPPSY